MTAEIVNLRQARKRKVRAEKVQQASEQRIKFGRSKSRRRHDAAETAIEERRLDGSLRTPSNPSQSD